MFSLRRAAFRVLSSSPSASVTNRTRSITSLTPFNRCTARTHPILSLQKRFASDEAAVQAEPEADGATKAQHGSNSIAEAASTSSESYDNAPAASAADSAAENVRSVGEKTSHKATDAAENVGESVRNAASAVGESLSSAAGLGSSSYSSRGPSRGGLAQEESEPSKTVYVGNLFFDVRAEDLRKEFEKAGEVVDAKIINDQRGLSKGFGYVEFTSIETATKAVSLFNLQNFEGRRLSVQYSIARRSNNRSGGRNADGTERPLNSPTKTLFIGNMSFDMSDRDLNNLFREIKNVIDVRVAIDRRTGQPRGFAHADFTDVASAEAALQELRGKMVCGRPLRVDFSTSTGRAAVGANIASGA